MERKAILFGLGLGAAVVAVGAGVAVAGEVRDDDGHEVPITGEALERASQVALAHTGAGRVTDTEQGDEDSFYEIEVTLDDGTQVDVQLDEQFLVVAAQPDVEEQGDRD